MDGYRDEVFAAERRILQIETALGPNVPPRRRSPARVTVERVFVLIAAMMVGLTIGVVAVVAYASHQGALDAVQEKSVPPVRPAAPPRAIMTWYEPEAVWNAHRGPWSVEVDGETLLVGTLWLRGARELGLHAAAFDQKTLHTRWIAGPYPSVASFDASDRHATVVVRDRVILTDAHGTARVLDLRTGEELGTAPIRHGTRLACVDEKDRVLLGFGVFAEPNTTAALFPWELADTQPYVFDPATLKTTPIPRNRTYCQADPYCVSAARGACRQLTPEPLAAILAGKGLPSALTPLVFQAGGAGVARVAVLYEKERPEAVLGFQAGAHTATWFSPLNGAASPRELRSAEPTIGEHGFYLPYVTWNGVQRISAFDVATGVHRFDVDVPGTRRGNSVPFITARGADLFVPVDDEMLVLDARTGAFRGRLEGP